MNKHWILLISAILLGIGFYTYLFFSHFGQLPSLDQNIVGYLISIITSIGVIYAVHWINTLLDRYLSWKRHFLPRFSISTIVTLILAATIVMLVALIYFNVFRNTDASQLMEGYREEIIKTLILLFFAAIIFNTGYFAFYSYRQYSFIQISKVTQERKQLRLQFEALKSQLSPHYLFNSLNTISSLVYKDAIAAEDFIRRLALTFKYVITTDKQKLVPLKEEVEFIKSYYHLLKVRFGNSLNLEINIPEDVLLTSIPPLTLQILVENAVKHNQFNKDNRLEISVGILDNKYLRVSNNKLTPAEDVRSFRVGLDNIRMRYSFYSDSNIKVEDESFFMVQLPILELQKAG
jgi:sensor histidine kinase YesM